MKNQKLGETRPQLNKSHHSMKLSIPQMCYMKSSCFPNDPDVITRVILQYSNAHALLKGTGIKQSAPGGALGV